MVIREWRGQATLGKEADYPAHFQESVMPKLRALPGFIGAELCRRQLSDRVEFLVLTRWASMEAVRGFAGDDVEKTVVVPAAVASLSSFDQTARHYEVLE